MAFYPNPITINTVQETDDGCILSGVRGRGSDQKGLALMGAGFVERIQCPDGSSLPPENLGYVVLSECLTETKYKNKIPFSMSSLRALAVIFGSNHDTTVGFHLPLFAKSNEVGLNNDEYSDLLKIPNKPEILGEFLETGKYRGIPAADHMLGCIESYLIQKSRGKIKSAYQNK
jgi:hypothetical protein